MAGAVPGVNTASHDQSGTDRPCPPGGSSAGVDLGAPTVSAGCAELGPEDGLGELLGACDVGLAMAKAAGRNQVVAA